MWFAGQEAGVQSPLESPSAVSSRVRTPSAVQVPQEPGPGLSLLSPAQRLWLCGADSTPQLVSESRCSMCSTPEGSTKKNPSCSTLAVSAVRNVSRVSHATQSAGVTQRVIFIQAFRCSTRDTLAEPQAGGPCLPRCHAGPSRGMIGRDRRRPMERGEAGPGWKRNCVCALFPLLRLHLLGFCLDLTFSLNRPHCVVES